MRIHHVLVGEDFKTGQETRNSPAEENAERSEGSEEMKRPRHVFQQKTNGQQVKEDPDGARNSVMRLAPLPVDVADGNLTNAGSIPGGKRRDEAMHLPVKGNIVNHFATICFKRSSKVMNVDSGKFGHEPVGAARRYSTHDKIVDTRLAPSADYVVSLLQLGHKLRNLGRIMLQIAIHRQDVVSLGVVETR